MMNSAGGARRQTVATTLNMCWLHAPFHDLRCRPVPLGASLRDPPTVTGNVIRARLLRPVFCPTGKERRYNDITSRIIRAAWRYTAWDKRLSPLCNGATFDSRAPMTIENFFTGLQRKRRNDKIQRIRWHRATVATVATVFI